MKLILKASEINSKIVPPTIHFKLKLLEICSNKQEKNLPSKYQVGLTREETMS
mgnify:FL=1